MIEQGKSMLYKPPKDADEAKLAWIWYAGQALGGMGTLGSERTICERAQAVADEMLRRQEERWAPPTKSP